MLFDVKTTSPNDGLQVHQFRFQALGLYEASCAVKHSKDRWVKDHNICESKVSARCYDGLVRIGFGGPYESHDIIVRGLADKKAEWTGGGYWSVNWGTGEVMVRAESGTLGDLSEEMLEAIKYILEDAVHDVTLEGESFGK